MIGADVKCKCKYCGSNAIAHTDTVLTSIPPQYNVDCPKCGRIYMLCSEVCFQDLQNFLTIKKND